MTGVIRILRVAAALLLLLFQGVQADESAVPPLPGSVADLGNGRYRIGQISIDRTKGSFSVPATVIDLGQPGMPLEFLAVSKGGPKAYESALELETSALEFNLACILIGLDEERATAPRGRFDPAPADGDPVELWLSWRAEGDTIRQPIGAILSLPDGESASDGWVYVGSYFTPDGRFAAEISGIVIGFVHDQESIIQHRSGLGLEGYGAVTIREAPEVVPGMPVLLTVTRP